MLESFFQYPRVLARMRVGPLAGEIDLIAEGLGRLGYADASTKRYLSLMTSFSRFAARNGCVGPKDLDDAIFKRFLVEFPVSVGTRSVAQTALTHVHRHLAVRYPPPAEPVVIDDPDTSLLTTFEAHLRDARGLRSRSREGVLLAARRMLRWCREQRPALTVSSLTGQDVLALVSRLLDDCRADATRSEAVSHVRSFLRYLHGVGMIRTDLARMVPRVPCWRLARIPDCLSWPEVRTVIEAIGTADPVAKRDRALILLLATTGLRSQEVRRLELADVGWRTGELSIRRTKSRRERVVPLLDEPGQALAEYVLHGRPRADTTRIFLRHVPPVAPLKHPSTISAIVRRRLADCGIRPKRAGTHLFRHSLATRMVRQNRPVKEVADLLGHQRIDTTAIYVKVALPQLEEVALPFPGGDA